MSTVTAIVPAYERPDHIVTAIEGVLEQTYPNVHVLVGDDSSSDVVERAVARFDPERVTYHRNRPALGAMRNWVDLIARADTEFVASLNDDDFWEPEFLARTVPAMLSDPNIAMSFSDVWYVDEAGRRLPRLSAFWSARSHRDQLPTGRLDLSSEELFRMISVWNSPQPAYAAVLRRDAVGKIDFPSEADPCHDLWCSYRLWTSGYGFHYTNARLTNYRVHTGNLTNAGIGEAEDYIFAVMERENLGREALTDMRHRLARTQFSRATGLASVDTAAAQRQFSAAARGLTGWRGRVASTGAHSPLACDIVGRLKRFKDAAAKTSTARIFGEHSQR